MMLGVAAMLMMGVKSVVGLYGILALIAGLAAVVDTVAIPSEYPSGTARAVSVAPITPPPPALFSTTTGWPRALLNGSAITRAMMSVVPPGANGTCSLIGLLG